MKQEDIDRLKEKLGDGYKITAGYNCAVIELNDPWDGVEFVELLLSMNGFEKGKIGRIVDRKDKFFDISCPVCKSDSFYAPYVYYIDRFLKPSNESAYVDQLKKECFERYGEIKYGDKFQSDWCDIKPIQTIGHGSYEFSYWKNTDNLLFNGVSIYSSGKWAKKIPERVKVIFKNDSWDGVENGKVEVGFVFEINKDVDIKNSGYFLAIQLESYLNNEAGN